MNTEMDNQQPSVYRNLIVNCAFGDGSFWKHPKSANTNSKMVFVSTVPQWLDEKMRMYPTAFGTGVKHKKRTTGFPNAKPIYILSSLTHTEITKAHFTPIPNRIEWLRVEDFGMWFLDDGATILRKDNKSVGYTFVLAIGSLGLFPEFTDKLKELFGSNYGSIRRNGSKASDKNWIWRIPHPVMRQILPFIKPWFTIPMTKVQRLSEWSRK